MKGNVLEEWGKLTDDHISETAGKREQLMGKIQETYGVSKEEAGRQVDEFAASLHDALFSKPKHQDRNR